MTGQIPAPVRARVLADHHAAQAAQRRAAVAARVRDGNHPQVIPFGYTVDGARPDFAPPRPGRTARFSTGTDTGVGERGGRVMVAPPYLWVRDPDAAAAIEAMVRWCLDYRPDAWIAGRLNAARAFPAPLDPRTGAPGVFTPGFVARTLTHPVYTGHQIWFRRRDGRPRPAHEWIRSTRPSHPVLIDDATFVALRRIRPARRGRLAYPARSR